jgi:hypothetical protein
MTHKLTQCRRKEKWKEGALNRNRKPSHTNRACTTIEKLQRSAKCPNKFRVSARIIDFDPPDLKDAIILYCTNCKKEYVCYALRYIVVLITSPKHFQRSTSVRRLCRCRPRICSLSLPDVFSTGRWRWSDTPGVRQ